MVFIAALRCNRIEAPCVFDGPINGALFATPGEGRGRAVARPALARGDRHSQQSGLANGNAGAHLAVSST